MSVWKKKSERRDYWIRGYYCSAAFELANWLKSRIGPLRASSYRDAIFGVPTTPETRRACPLVSSSPPSPTSFHTLLPAIRLFSSLSATLLLLRLSFGVVSPPPESWCSVPGATFLRYARVFSFSLSLFFSLRLFFFTEFLRASSSFFSPLSSSPCCSFCNFPVQISVADLLDDISAPLLTFSSSSSSYNSSFMSIYGAACISQFARRNGTGSM